MIIYCSLVESIKRLKRLTFLESIEVYGSPNVGTFSSGQRKLCQRLIELFHQRFGIITIAFYIAYFLSSICNLLDPTFLLYLIARFHCGIRQTQPMMSICSNDCVYIICTRVRDSHIRRLSSLLQFSRLRNFLF